MPLCRSRVTKPPPENNPYSKAASTACVGSRKKHYKRRSEKAIQSQPSVFSKTLTGVFKLHKSHLHFLINSVHCFYQTFHFLPDFKVLRLSRLRKKVSRFSNRDSRLFMSIKGFILHFQGILLPILKKEKSVEKTKSTDCQIVCSNLTFQILIV